MARSKNRKRKEKKYKSKHPKKEKKRIPLIIQRFLNQLLRFSFGVLLFWILYYPFYDSEITLLEEISYIIFFNAGASMGAFFCSIFFLYGLTYITKTQKPDLKRIKGPNKTMQDLNVDILFEIIAMCLTSASMIVGTLTLLTDYFGNFYTAFIMYYFVVKFIMRVVAYGLASWWARHPPIAFACVLLFMCLMIFAGASLLASNYFERFTN